MPVLLGAAEGLRRGRRAAWVAALLLNVVLGLLGLALAAHTGSAATEQRILLGAGVHVHAWFVLALPALQPLVVAAVLVAMRRRFAQRAPAGTYRGAARVAVVTLVAVSAVFVLSLVVREGYDRPPGLWALLQNLPTRFLPPGYLGELEPAFVPVSTPAVVLFDWSGPVLWAVVGGLMLASFTRTVTGDDRRDQQRVRAVLSRGGSSLSYMVTWPGHSYWFTLDGTAAVAYRVIGGVAITTGGPVGEPSAQAAATAGFVAHCRESCWTPCFYAVEETVARVAQDMGWSRVQVAEETVLSLADLSFTGRKWQDVRTALNRAQRAGIVAEWTCYREAPRVVTDQIRAISEEWAAEKRLPEMGFTLGGPAELDDPQVRLLLAVDGQRRVHAVTSWLPVRRDGTVIGWSLDFMRRRADAPNGVMEFLIASAAIACQAEGARFISLSAAPLARVNDDQPAHGVQRLLDALAGRLEPVYGFSSLLSFKAKFQPEYRPLHMAYPDPVALPAIGNALARAYLPDLSPRQLTRLVRAILR